jgi:hypothetical protein
MSDRLLRYLYSRKNLVGSMLALVGLALSLAGIVRAPWPAVVILFYLVAALLTPSSKAIELQAGIDANDIHQALDAQVRAATGKVPADVMARLLKIRHIILEILPRSGTLPPGSPEWFVIERTATSYLPRSLEGYLSLPRAYATLHPVRDGKTAKQILIDQLTLLENKMTEVADDVHRNDADRLLANGRFLEDRFSRSPLSLPPPAATEK